MYKENQQTGKLKKTTRNNARNDVKKNRINTNGENGTNNSDYTIKE